MANYLVIKNGNDTKSYEAKTTHTSVPYLRVGSGYLDLTTMDGRTSSTSYYIGSEDAVYQTAYITNTSVSWYTRFNISAESTSGEYVSSTYTSDSTKSVVYDDPIITNTLLTTSMMSSKYTTNSSAVPYNRVFASGSNICTKTSSTIITNYESLDLKVKVITQNELSTYYGIARTMSYVDQCIALTPEGYGSIVRRNNGMVASRTTTLPRSISDVNTITSYTAYSQVGDIKQFQMPEMVVTNLTSTSSHSVSQTYRPLEYHSYSVSTSTSSTLIRYIWNSAETYSSSVTTTISNTMAQGASYCQTWIGSKVTFSVNITSTNGNTGTGTVTRNYVSMVATQSNEDIMKTMGSRLNSISNSYFNVDKSSDKPISASYFISHTRKHSNATSENEFYRSANTTVSNATTAYLFSDTATSSTLITKIYPRSLESGSWTCTDYAVGEYKRTYSDINGNVVTKADGLVSISRVNISRTIEPVSSTTTLVTETNYYHDFTFTTNSSRTFSITAWKGTASLYTVSDNNRRYSQTVTVVNRYVNSSSTAYDSVSYSLVESATTSVSTTISSSTEI